MKCTTTLRHLAWAGVPMCLVLICMPSASAQDQTHDLTVQVATVLAEAESLLQSVEGLTTSEALIGLVARLDAQEGTLQDLLTVIDDQLEPLEKALALQNRTRHFHMESTLFEESVGGIPGASRSTTQAGEPGGREGSDGNEGESPGEVPPDGTDDSTMPPIGASNLDDLVGIPAFSGWSERNNEYQSGIDEDPSGSESSSNRWELSHEQPILWGGGSSDLLDDGDSGGILAPATGGADETPDDGRDPLGGAMEVITPDEVTLPSIPLPGDGTSEEAPVIWVREGSTRGAPATSEHNRIEMLRQLRQIVLEALERLDQCRRQLTIQLEQTQDG